MGASGNKEERNEMKKELKNELKNGKNEVIIGSKPIPLKIANKVNKAICKITIETNEGIAHGTGFFFELFRFKKIFNDMLSCNKSKFRK